MADSDLLPYSAGRNASKNRPSSKVRIYDRPDRPGEIYMTRAWVKTASGRPEEIALPDGMSVKRARLFVDETVTEREIAILEGRTIAGEKKPVTVKQLLEKYHAWLDTQDRAVKTMDDKHRCRKFWLAALGSTQATQITRAEVQRLAALARKRGGHSTRWDRKRLEYLRAAVRWGYDDAQILPSNPLRGLKLPEYSPDTEGLDYSAKEQIQLSTPHPDVDWRVTLMVSVITDTGRRRSSVLAISAERDLVVQNDRLHVIFRKEFDKRRRNAVVPVSAETHLLVAEALERTEVIESGWLFPEGRLEYVDPVEKPWNPDAATKALHRAEKALGIEHVHGRAFHGGKRRHVTASWEEASGDAALVGDVTGNVDANLLRNTYRQLNRKRTTTHVDGVRARLRAEAEDDD